MSYVSEAEGLRVLLSELGEDVGFLQFVGIGVVNESPLSFIS